MRLSRSLNTKPLAGALHSQPMVPLASFVEAGRRWRHLWLGLHGAKGQSDPPSSRGTPKQVGLATPDLTAACLPSTRADERIFRAFSKVSSHVPPWASTDGSLRPPSTPGDTPLEPLQCPQWYRTSPQFGSCWQSVKKLHKNDQSMLAVPISQAYSPAAPLGSHKGTSPAGQLTASCGGNQVALLHQTTVQLDTSE